MNDTEHFTSMSYWFPTLPLLQMKKLRPRTGIQLAKVSQPPEVNLNLSICPGKGDLQSHIGAFFLLALLFPFSHRTLPGAHSRLVPRTAKSFHLRV